MEKQRKIRVAMICHFSNAEVRSHLPLDNRRLYSIIRKVLRMPTKGRGYSDFASWDVNIIEEFKKHPDVELHVISAHTGLKKSVVSYLDDDVHYNFVNCDKATMLKHVIPNNALWRKLNPMVPAVHRIVRKARPDLVILVGAENAYIASTVLGLKEFPRVVLCQTVYNNPDRAKYSNVDSKNASTEMAIIKEVNHFCVYSKMHYETLRRLNSDVNIFKFGWPSTGKLLTPTPCEKKYDFVNFSRGLSDKKGYPDAIRALAIVKKKYPSVSLNLVGSGSEEALLNLQSLCEECGVTDNVVFTPNFAKREDVLLHIQKSRFALLPCKLDNTSGTMTQAMQLGLPLVVYKTTGTPSFNRKKECVLIAEKGNVDQLAQHMLTLMGNQEKAELLKKNARQLQEQRVAEARKNGDRLMQTFRAVVDHYKNNTPIPQELLFNPERDD